MEKKNKEIIKELTDITLDGKLLWIGERIDGGLNFSTRYKVTTNKWIRVDVGKKYREGIQLTYLELRYFDGSIYHYHKSLLARKHDRIYNLFDLCKERAK